MRMNENQATFFHMLQHPSGEARQIEAAAKCAHVRRICLKKAKRLSISPLFCVFLFRTHAYAETEWGGRSVCVFVCMCPVCARVYSVDGRAYGWVGADDWDVDLNGWI